MSRDVHICSHWVSFDTLQIPPPPPHLDSYYEGAIGQQRQTTSLCNPLPFALIQYAQYQRKDSQNTLCIVSRHVVSEHAEESHSALSHYT